MGLSKNGAITPIRNSWSEKIREYRRTEEKDGPNYAKRFTLRRELFAVDEGSYIACMCWYSGEGFREVTEDKCPIHGKVKINET